ncbi:MAG TPA: hypothetical protein VN224_03275 [Xanthomonadales bacterium]|nr:hypothetical protein [Xanthomonadales bacterium]
MRRTAVLASITLVLAGSSGALAQHAAPSGTFKGCRADGPPAAFDKFLNDQKNRSALPTGTIPTMTIAQITAKAPKRNPESKTPRAQWKPAERKSIEAFEAKPLRIEAFMNAVLVEGPEQSNCGAPKGKGDTHIYLVDKQKDPNTTAAFAEVTPRWLSTNPSWTQPAIHALAAQGARVRVTGWPMYDEEHYNMIVAGNRGTLWELHPITNFEVSTSSGWVSLAKLKPSAKGGTMAMAMQAGGGAVQLTNARSPQDAAKFLQQEAKLAELERKSE